ncbi:hypothetical protein ACSNOH_28620 [Streptomyces sp. URMC 127]|uniref:hypothetical protein n=1 Tax=Streptomyces sp. URMC 127 TaxID=3423402 RepID=UPI003F1D9E06
MPTRTAPTTSSSGPTSLDGLDECSNTLRAQVVALIKGARGDGVTDRAQNRHASMEAARLPFRYAIRSDAQDLAATRWINGEQAVRDRWHRLVRDRRSHLSR